MKRVKEYALRQGRTLTEILSQALQEMLSRAQKTKPRKPVKLTTFGGGGLMPGIDLNNSAALWDLLDEEEYDSYRRQCARVRPPK